MDIETITKLLDAGYTKQEIDAMVGGAGTDAGAAENEGAGEEKQNANEVAGDANKENAKQIAENVEMGAAIEALTNTVKGLQETVKAIQTGNANAAATETPKTDKINDVMQSFIDTL